MHPDDVDDAEEVARERSGRVRVLRASRETLDGGSRTSAPGVSARPSAPGVSAPGIAPGMLVADRYLIGPSIGTGGHGAVYSATHVQLDLPVAIKVLGLPALEHEDSAGPRFEREARTIARVRHRNVLHIHDAGRLPDGSPYLVTELIQGHDLEQRIARGPLGVPAVVDLGRQLFSALAAIAEAGVLHRDVKPANVMLRREADGHVQVTLIDFGIARKRDELTKLTVTGTILGTPHYMSPEQLRGEPLDPRADLYAASALLYEALTGLPPYDGPTAPIVIGRILTEPLAPVRSLRPDCPADLAELVERGLARDRDLRPAHPLEVVVLLERIAHHGGLPTGSLAWADDPSLSLTPPIALEQVRRVDIPRPVTPAEPAPVPVPPLPPGPSRDPVPRRARRVVGATVLGAAALAVALLAPWSWDEVSAETLPTPAAEAPASFDVDRTLDEGFEALARGEVEAALSRYREAATLAPDRAEAHRGRGLAAARAGLDEEAIVALESYLSLAPDAADAARIRDRLRRLRVDRTAPSRTDTNARH